MPALGVTMATLVDETRDHLLSGRRAPLNRLDESVGETDDFLLLRYDATQVRDGAYLALNDEVVYVWSREGQRVNVERGVRGTTAADHVEGDRIEVEPRFPAGIILRVLQREIQSWPEDVFAIETITTSVGLTDDAIDLSLTGTAGVYRLLEVAEGPGTDAEGWTPIAGALLRRASSYSIGFGREYGRAASLRVTVARAFDLSDLTSETDLGDVGLAATMLDIPSLGAAARLVTNTEVERTDDYARSSSQSAEAVPPGHRLRAGATLWQLRNDRLSDERRRLVAAYGYGLALS